MKGARREMIGVLIAFMAGVAGAQARPASVWIEGEDAVHSRRTGHNWYDSIKIEEVSGGKWLSNFGKQTAGGEASYKLEIPVEGEYAFFLRANPVRTRMRYRVDRGEWIDIDTAAGFDRVNVAADNGIDLRFLAWMDLGKIALKKGEHTVEFHFDSDTDRHGAIDAFVLTMDDHYRPVGAQKPGEARPKASAPPGMWAFDPPPDRFSDEAMLDLRSMNEASAGETGFVRLGADGESFVRGDGRPIRFWALTTYVHRQGERALAEHARFLAKRGVNMVRWHGNLPPVDDPDSRLNDINEKALDELFKLVAAMKKEGIYLTVSPYYPHATHTRENGTLKFKNWGITETSGDNPTGLLFFHPGVQEAYKAWLKEMLTRTNPYTGIALKDEPAIAIFQIQNEDSLLFWTISQIQGEDLDILRGRFGEWLKKKYGSLEAVRRAWGGARPEGAGVGDDWNRGLVSLPQIWHLTQPTDAASPRGKRYADSTQFLGEIMRDWNLEVKRYLREEIGAPHLINAGNWRTADDTRLGDAERYSYTANEVIGVNRYVGFEHAGPRAGYAIQKGDRYTDDSILVHPEKLATSLRQPAGHPFIIPESLWVPPMSHQGEGPFLISVMQSLSGVDAFYWFSVGSPQWQQPGESNRTPPFIGKWHAATPETLGNFPAAAVLFRNGYVEEGAPVVVERRSLSQVWNREIPLITEEAKFDPNRDTVDQTGKTAAGKVSPLAFLVGPVKVMFDDQDADDLIVNISPFINASEKVVTSNTGQIRWDYDDGHCLVDAPKAQGVAGFLSKKNAFDLSDVGIRSGNEYGTVLIVSLDDRPIASSSRLLVQAGTRATPTNWKTRPATWMKKDERIKGLEVVDHGRAPWLLMENEMTITIHNRALTKATALDPNFMPQAEVELKRDGNGVTFTMPEDSKYVVIE